METVLITRERIRSLSKGKGLKSIVPYLLYIQKDPSVLKEMVSINRRELDEVKKSGILFHGSKQLFKLIKPYRTTNHELEVSSDAFVYATSDPNYAIFLAILHMQPNGSASVDTSKEITELSVNLGFVNGKSTLDKGYVHIVTKNNFKDVRNSEYVSKNTVTVLCSFEVLPSDLTVPIIIRDLVE